MNSFGVTMGCCCWQWTSFIILFLSPVLVSAMTIPSDHSPNDRCQWVCSRGLGVVLGCECSQRKLAKQFAMLDPDTPEAKANARISLLLENLFRTKDYGNALLEDSKADEEYPEQMPLVHQKRGYIQARIPNGVANTGIDEDEAIKMVRSKKRWLSLHDDFDSRAPEGDMVVPDLWQDEASRKAFRYG